MYTKYNDISYTMIFYFASNTEATIALLAIKFNLSIASRNTMLQQFLEHFRKR